MSFAAMTAAVGRKRALRQFGKDAVRRVLRPAGLELKQIRPGLIDFLASRDVDLVIDVGANDGQFAQRLRLDGYAGDILSIEPLAGVYAELSRHASRDPRWQTRQLGLGARPGTLELNVSEKSYYSSFKQTAAAGLDFDAGAAAVRTQSVQVSTVDAVADMARASRTFLKIDTQGFEREVLEGAETFLRHCVGVQLELPILHLYDEVWTMDQAIAFMTQRGFVVAMTEAVNLLEDGVSAVELDCVFRRAQD